MTLGGVADHPRMVQSMFYKLPQGDKCNSPSKLAVEMVKDKRSPTQSINVCEISHRKCSRSVTQDMEASPEVAWHTRKCENPPVLAAGLRNLSGIGLIKSMCSFRRLHGRSSQCQNPKMSLTRSLGATNSRLNCFSIPARIDLVGRGIQS